MAGVSASWPICVCLFLPSTLHHLLTCFYCLDSEPLSWTSKFRQLDHLSWTSKFLLFFLIWRFWRMQLYFLHNVDFLISFLECLINKQGFLLWIFFFFWFSQFLTHPFQIHELHLLLHSPSLHTHVCAHNLLSPFETAHMYVWRLCWELTTWDWITYLLLHHRRLTLPLPVATDSLYLILHLGVEPCGISPMQDNMLTGTVTFQVLFTQPFSVTISSVQLPCHISETLPHR